MHNVSYHDTAFVFMVDNKVFMVNKYVPHSYALQPEYDYLLYDICLSKSLYSIMRKAEYKYQLDRQAEIEQKHHV